MSKQNVDYNSNSMYIFRLSQTCHNYYFCDVNHVASILTLKFLGEPWLKVQKMISAMTSKSCLINSLISPAFLKMIMNEYLFTVEITSFAN